MADKILHLPMADITLSWPLVLFLTTCGVYVMIKVIAPLILRILLAVGCGALIIYGSRLNGASVFKTMLRMPKHAFLAIRHNLNYKMQVTEEVSFDFREAQFYNHVTENIPWLSMMAYGIQKQHISFRLKIERDEPATDGLPAGLNCKTEIIMRLGNFSWRGTQHKCLTIDRLTHEAECVVGFDLQMLQRTLTHYAPAVEFILVRTPNKTIEDLSTVTGVYFTGTFDKDQSTDQFVIFPASPNVRDFKTYMDAYAK